MYITLYNSVLYYIICDVDITLFADYVVVVMLVVVVVHLKDDATPLHKAAEQGHLQIVQLLLSKGAEVNSRDKVSTSTLLIIVIIMIVC